MINTTAVQNLVSKLDPVWFKKKKESFEQEGLYDKATGKISDELPISESFQVADDKWEEHERYVKVDINFPSYCWDSFFYGSQSYSLDPETSGAVLPVDANEIAGKIIEVIYKDIEKFTDVHAINAVIEKVIESITQQAKQLQQIAGDEEYTAAINDFLSRAVNEINFEFTHIKNQLELRKVLGGTERKLTPEICSKIAAFKVNGKRLITNVEGPLDEGHALLQLLTPGSGNTSSMKIFIADWANKDVYYLLIKLESLLTSRFSIAGIEKKKALFLKTGKLFTQSLFNTFRSQKLEAYTSSDTNKSAIDALVTSLF